ncbi:peptidase M14 [Achromobacter pulmonis]|uniref:Peptidase M14 n=1 Tax=Achromobacter pulmonis TaxID=1389932 RepID=A0A2N8KL71_9BURK|nr:peptidase M14 [Achromobacter pulmonis]MBO9329056.1 peptidase M14 [Achromobacter xylosoxidans]PND34200.1 peptidase M14 [Achromobacter pulmonis]
MPLLEKTFDRTLDAWTHAYMAPAWRGATVEGWLFEGPQARLAAQARLAQAGVAARFRSAYKPLLHFFLEEVERAGLVSARVRYPVHEHAHARRFALEAYPLVGLLDGVRVTLEAGADDLHYDVALGYADGSVIEQRVYAPNQLGHAPDGTPELSPTGWLRVRDAEGALHTDAAHLTEYQQVFRSIVDTVRARSWGAHEPFFERLEIRVDLPGIEYALPVDEEIVSTFEALHEDLYFSLLEFFQRHSGRPAGDRGLQPGQIVPDIRRNDGAARVRMTLEPFAALAPLVPAAPAMPLAQMREPLSAAQIAGCMADLGGDAFQAVSREGRPVLGTYLRGPGPAVFISGAQHANETSGVVGALRAAQALAAAGDPHFALIAAENPDGYALFNRLRERHPRHMLHASRYSALGDDIAHRENAPFFEREGRHLALAISGAQLHINLHGYPAHEWTRPLSGYLPRHFERWTIPKGFFLVMRHHPGWGDRARRLVAGVTARLARDVAGLVEFNARQLERFQAHAVETGFDLHHGIPVQIEESDREAVPLTLISEFPDETVYGERYVFAHTVQMETVLAATGLYRAGL